MESKRHLRNIVLFSCETLENQNVYDFTQIPRAIITSDAKKKDVNDDTNNTKNNVLFVFEDVARSMRRGGLFVFFFV
jgi:hypothetical protein